MSTNGDLKKIKKKKKGKETEGDKKSCIRIMIPRMDGIGTHGCNCRQQGSKSAGRRAGCILAGAGDTSA